MKRFLICIFSRQVFQAQHSEVHSHQSIHRFECSELVHVLFHLLYLKLKISLIIRGNSVIEITWYECFKSTVSMNAYFSITQIFFSFRNDCISQYVPSARFLLHYSCIISIIFTLYLLSGVLLLLIGF